MPHLKLLAKDSHQQLHLRTLTPLRRRLLLQPSQELMRIGASLHQLADQRLGAGAIVH